jgi:hypothetical protein
MIISPLIVAFLNHRITMRSSNASYLYYDHISIQFQQVIGHNDNQKLSMHYNSILIKSK